MPNQVGSPLRYYQKWAFVVEIDGIKVGGFTEFGPLKQELSLVVQDEGGARTAVDKSTSTFKSEKITLSRGGSDNDELYQWWVNLKAGNQDKRNISVVQQDGAGNPIVRFNLATCVMVSYEAGTWDRKAETENILEKIEIEYIDYERKLVA